MLTPVDPSDPDPVNDAMRVWPQAHEACRVNAGAIVISQTDSQIERHAGINSKFLIPTNGIAPSDDPVRATRCGPYAVLFYRPAQAAAGNSGH